MATGAERSRRSASSNGKPLVYKSLTLENNTMMQFFEWYVPKDGHWKRYADEAPRLAEMGITACWIPRMLACCVY